MSRHRRRRLVQLEDGMRVKAHGYSAMIERAASLRNIPRCGTYLSVTFMHALTGCWRMGTFGHLRGVSYFKAYDAGPHSWGTTQVVPVYRVEDRRVLWASILDIRAKLALELLAEGEEGAA